MGNTPRSDFFDLSLDLLAIVGFDGYFKDVSPSWTRTLGWTREELLSNPFGEFIHPEDRESTLMAFQQAIAGQPLKPYRNRYRHKNGTYRWLEWNAHILPHQNKSYSVARDITEIWFDAQLNEQIQTVAKIGAWQYDMLSKEHYLSREIHRILLTDPNVFVPNRNSLKPFFPPGGFETFISYCLQAAEKGEAFDYQCQMISANGDRKWVRIIGKAERVGDVTTRLYGSLQDISALRKTELELIRAKDKYESLIEGSEDFIWEKDLSTGKVTFANTEPCLRIFGRKTEELNSDPDTNIGFVIPEDRWIVDEGVADARAHGRAVMEFRAAKKGGTIIWTRVRLKMIYDEQHNPAVVQGVTTDITKEKERAEAIARETRKLELVTRHIQDVIWLVNRKKDELVYISPGYEIVWEKSCDSIRENYKSFLESLHPDDRPKKIEAMKRPLSASPYVLDYRIVTPSGKMKWARDRSFPIHEEGREPEMVVGIVTDITLMKEQERLIAEQQAQMIATAKMSSLGEMAGGMAHEINNPLAIIYARARKLKNLLQADAATKDEMLEGLVRIEETAMRISKIVRGLRTFARNGDADPFIESSLRTIVEDSLELCRERFKNSQVRLQIEPFEDVPFSCRPTQISQVLLNLLNNAYDAVADLPEKWVKIDVARGKETCGIRVMDSGPGIPESVVSRMMEPFYTTKEVGKGTGLGLSIAKGIVDDHRGHLYYDTKARHTCFVIELPI